MNPHPRHDAPELAPDEPDALIYKFPVNEWDRLELWARRELAKEERAMEARNAALKRI